jgi:D-inositol-3-phosphate glycosyltransferase
MASKGRTIKEKPRLLWIGDAVAHTGFATVCHSVLDQLHDRYDVHVLGINYFGDPHQYKYSIYPASTGGDVFGLKRTPALLQQIRPHITMIVNDPWIVRDYIQPLSAPIGKINNMDVFTHKVAYMPIDGKNIQPAFVQPLNELERAIFYTQFGLDEARKNGFESDRVDIVPHGVDLTDFAQMSTDTARNKLTSIQKDWFVVGCVNRNQPRKRIDLALEYFAEWVKDKPMTVKFYYHGALQDVGWNILQLADYYGINDRMIITDPNMSTAIGVPRSMLKYIYNSFDVQITTTLGEGWGLTQMEGMACGVPQIVPRWSALGEWADGGAAFVECTATQANSGGLNTIGGIADKAQFIQELDRMYFDIPYRKKIGKAGYDLVRQPQFQWKNVADKFDQIFKKVMQP